MTVCKVQECKITTKFNTFFRVCNSAFFFLNETVHRDGFFNHIENAYSSNHLWDSYWTEQDLQKKISAATENYLHVHFKVDTSSSSVSSMLAPEVDSVSKT